MTAEQLIRALEKVPADQQIRLSGANGTSPLYEVDVRANATYLR